MKKIFSIIALMLTVATGAVAQTTYTTTVKEGTEDADKWTISPTEAAEGTTVTVTYTGTKKVKSIKAVKKAAPATAIVTWNYSDIMASVNFDTYSISKDGVTIQGFVVSRNEKL